MRAESRGLKLSYLYVFIVFCLTLNAVKYWPLFGITSICFGIGIILPFIICPSFFSTRMFQFFSLYALVVLINHLLGDAYLSNRGSLLIGFVGFFASMSMSYYVFTNSDYKLMRAIIYTVLIVLLWTTVVTAYFDYLSPGIVRMVNSIVREGGVESNSFNSLYAAGLSSYYLPHAVPILITPFVIGIKNSSLTRKERIISAVMLVCCLLLVYFSGATGPLLVAIVILLLSFVVRKGSVRLNIFILVVGVLLVVPFILNEDLMLAALEWVDDLVGGEGYFHKKIMDFQDSIFYNEASGDIEVRSNLYDMTFDAIMSHPIFGVLERHGGHSALFDRFASLGLVGFVPLIAIFVVQTQYIKKIISSQYHVYYYLSLVAAFLMLTFKNATGWGMWFFLFAAMPFLFVYYSNADGHCLKN